LLIVTLLAGCGQKSSKYSDQQHASKHQHIPPHHGTPVVLGNEEYHVELVLDPSSGKLEAYILDGELENFIRIQQASFEIIAKISGRDESLLLNGVPNKATGETVGDTSLFEAQADWLKTTPVFDASIKELNVRGSAYRNVSFNFPKGNDTDEKSNSKQPAARKTSAGYLEVGFDQLSGFSASVTYDIVNSNSPAFYYAPRLADEIPDEIKALNGKEVAIQGFMLPLKGEAGRVQEFILLKNQSYCCFGKPPKVNEWVHVRVKGEGLKPLMDQVVTIYGTLQVGEYSENRQMLGIYRLQGDGMAIPRQF